MSTRKKEPLELTGGRARLDAARDQGYWRSLEQLADTDEFRRLLYREFPGQASLWADSIGRRQFLQLMSASLALAGLGGCARPPAEKIVPYVRAPEEMVPGKPLFFATAMSMVGIGTGLLVESHMGRPIKIEGNPDHPASLGATDAFAQASILTLYDPDRSQTVTHLGQISSWSEFLQEFRAAVQTERERRGAGLRILTETVTSPTLHHQIRSLLQEFPEAKWHQYEPVGNDMVRAGARLAFGEYVNTVYRFDRADVVLSLDADFLSRGPGQLRYVRDFAAGRRVGEGRQLNVATREVETIGSARDEMNRLYVVESTPSITGAKADHRMLLRPSAIEGFARAVAARLGVFDSPLQIEEPDPRSPSVDPRLSDWLTVVVQDLQRHRGSCLVLAGEYQPPAVHALAHAINHALNNAGQTVIYTDPIEAEPIDQIESFKELVRDMDAGQVDLLLIIGGNPAFTAPADLEFSRVLDNVRLRVHLSLYDDETSALCHWHLPEAHYLESWSDTRAYDGTVSIVQPLIAPLYGGKSAHELLAAFMDDPERPGYEIVREHWRQKVQDLGFRVQESEAHDASRDFEQFWLRVVHDGVIAGTALPEKTVELRRHVLAVERLSISGASLLNPEPRTLNPPLELIFRPDPTIFDGRFANNGWLQELPKPLTKLTWDNAALMSRHTAEDRFQLRNGDVVELEYDGRKVFAPIWIIPGHSDDCVTVHLGHGRTRAGKVGTGVGFNAYAIRTSQAPWFGSGLRIRKTDTRHELACTQHHHLIDGRDLIRSGTIDEYRANPQFAHKTEHEPDAKLTLYPSYEYSGYKWGMAIDLNSCVGCNACIVACQAENNIPIVGKEEVLRGREMHWLRVDTYHKGDPDRPESLETYFQPVPCMQCENAPCEVVCPVAATVHSAEGLNDMVYNRCVGTRYCSNNCPYKVRRFNFLQYSDFHTPSLKLMRNPDVTVRSRGVMEKCTYCVQRINTARITAEKENRRVRDGELMTACQAACPAQAIVFGDLNDPTSRVSRWKAEPLNYALLAELNTRPRTTYLAAVRNPNPELQRGS